MKKHLLLKSKKIPQAIKYIPFSLSKEIKDLGETLQAEKIRSIVRNQLAGVPVELLEEKNLPSLMIVLDELRKFSPEVIFKTKENQRFLIFNITNQVFLRPKDINLSLNFSLKKYQKKFQLDSLSPKKEIIIHLEKIWSETKEKNFAPRIKKALKEAVNQVSPAEIAILTGEKPPLLFLLVQFFLYGIAGEIWYQKNFQNSPIKIYGF
ncbi:hypothetical protein J7J41_00715 [bacterium]|nr:hypothetical protein [bacterium]